MYWKVPEYWVFPKTFLVSDRGRRSFVFWRRENSFLRLLVKFPLKNVFPLALRLRKLMFLCKFIVFLGIALNGSVWSCARIDPTHYM